MKTPKKVMIHSPAGGQGKTTTTANLSMMIARLGKKTLAIDACPTKGLQIYFNVQADYGISELLSGTPAENLIGEIQENLSFLPGGDLVEAEMILTKDKIAPYLNLEKKLRETENRFDFIFIDTSANEDSRLFFSLLFYADIIITPVETKRAGVDKLFKFRDMLEGLNPRLREHEGKPPLKINRVIPYWYGRSLAKATALEALKEEFNGITTGPIGECTGLVECLTQGKSLAERLEGIKSPRSNEAHILEVYNDLVNYLVTE